MASVLEEIIEELHSIFERTDVDIEWKKMLDGTYRSMPG